MIFPERNLVAVVHDASVQTLVLLVASWSNRAAIWSLLLWALAQGSLARNRRIFWPVVWVAFNLWPVLLIAELLCFLFGWNCMGAQSWFALRAQSWFALLRASALPRVYTLLRFSQGSTLAFFIEIQSAVLAPDVSWYFAWAEWAAIKHWNCAFMLSQFFSCKTIKGLAAWLGGVGPWIVRL